MNYKIIAIEDFKKDAKRLVKKYHSLKEELVHLQNSLLENPRLGVFIQENTYKIRLSVKSKGQGKRGGMRVITHVVEVEINIDEDTTTNSITIFLLAIYDKSEINSVSDKVLKYLINEINTELDEE
jgi:mRNA-degrading endonuclease RelE of RelBE toxin-antitoxin system